MDIQEVLKGFVGGSVLVGGVVFALWLTFVYLLYGGIMQAVNSWGVSNPDVVWGIIKTIFFTWGFIPGWLAVILGGIIIKA